MRYRLKFRLDYENKDMKCDEQLNGLNYENKDMKCELNN